MKHINVALFVTHLGCPHRCVFCDQRAISGAKAITADEIRAACATAAKTPHDPANSDCSFFGGSFTAIDRELMLDCLRAAYPFVESGDFAGIRVSTRPDAVGDDVLDILASYGVRAIELGAQSVDDRVLEMNERGHSSRDVYDASRRIKDAGFELGLQMMTGLCGSDDETDIRTAREFISLRPATVRIYPTVVIKGTRLEELMNEGKYAPATLEDSVALCARLLQMFDDAGIKVIRLGLHSGGDVSGNFAAGPYHPAFRELVESRIRLGRMLSDLAGKPPGKYTFTVPERELSKYIGQKRGNIAELAKRGYEVRVEKE